jgi:hypothetical protein
MKTTEVIFALSTVTGLGPATESASPNQALQHNDHVCHELCFRTPRASHDRG